MKRFKNSIKVEINLDFLDSNALNQRLYFTNLNFLTGRKIVHIKTFNDDQTGSANGNVINKSYLQCLGLNLVDMNGILCIENLSIADLSFTDVFPIYPTSESGLPITGQFDFEKSWITCYTNVAIVKGYILPITFYYE